MPVLLGGGKSIFPADGGKRPIELVSTTTTKTGAQMCDYRPPAEGWPPWRGCPRLDPTVSLTESTIRDNHPGVDDHDRP